jgi:hypothetical protein
MNALAISVPASTVEAEYNIVFFMSVGSSGDAAHPMYRRPRDRQLSRTHRRADWTTRSHVLKWQKQKLRRTSHLSINISE